MLPLHAVAFIPYDQIIAERALVAVLHKDELAPMGEGWNLPRGIVPTEFIVARIEGTEGKRVCGTFGDDKIGDFAGGKVADVSG